MTDFTTVTEFERFVARLETQLFEWQLHVACESDSSHLPKGYLVSAKWRTETHVVRFGNQSYTMEYHWVDCSSMKDKMTAIERQLDFPFTFECDDDVKRQFSCYLPWLNDDLLNAANDFVQVPHHLCRWFGIRKFLILIPTDHVIMNSAQRSMLLSSIAVALSNCNCHVPFFVQTNELKRMLYEGVCTNKHVRTSFGIVQLKSVPLKYCNLSGLLGIFKEKVAVCSTSDLRVRISVRLSYLLHERFDARWSQSPPELDANFSGFSVSNSSFGKLPSGVYDDALRELYLAATWTHMNEDMLVENESYSDLDALSAPAWSVRAVFSEVNSCLLADHLEAFLKLDIYGRQCNVILGVDRHLDESSDIASSFDRLTETTFPISAFTSIIQRQAAKQHSKSFANLIDDETLFRVMSYLFPHSKSAFGTSLQGSSDEESSSERNVNKATALNLSDVSTSSPATFTKLSSQVKSAPVDSLPWKLALSLSYFASTMQSASAVAYLWLSFVRELRNCWEGSSLIPGVSGHFPDLGACLLYQKLQMLNCCITHKIEREKDRLKENTVEPKPNVSSALENSASWHSLSSAAADENDDFFDCADDEFELECSRPPEGRLKQCGHLTLLKRPMEPLFVPFTQDPSPMTEDMLQQHSNVLTQLGTNADAAALRARIQSASLLSDMAAFKAANPGCCLEDFIRWYSPRDWECYSEDNEPSGHLSERMMIPNNAWQETWQGAKSCSASRQKRLFDDTREAEKILHWLSSFTVSEIARHMVPVLFSASLHHLVKKTSAIQDRVDVMFKLAYKLLTDFSLSVDEDTTLEHYKDLTKHINRIEQALARYECLTLRFREAAAEELELKSERSLCSKQATQLTELDIHYFVLALLTQAEVAVIGGPAGPMGRALTRIFRSDARIHRSESSTSFPPVLAREYILRAFCNRPTHCSRKCPQRMYASLSHNEFRLAGAFSDDSTFF